ncbi:hypothetical protein FA95DRAFT_697125 [Auriscalpium vulgare]|uniref:Uncharacterized protein n=1 Tax=Auriscalpium vulgare TaxID=40419 RepID=A0ACB8RCR9_9AGAM|nr:hypothetical protein FA95DRAFT_697125 [Auriscalpium vulgare]
MMPSCFTARGGHRSAALIHLSASQVQEGSSKSARPDSRSTTPKGLDVPPSPAHLLPNIRPDGVMRYAGRKPPNQQHRYLQSRCLPGTRSPTRRPTYERALPHTIKFKSNPRLENDGLDDDDEFERLRNVPNATQDNHSSTVVLSRPNVYRCTRTQYRHPVIQTWRRLSFTSNELSEIDGHGAFRTSRTHSSASQYQMVKTPLSWSSH